MLIKALKVKKLLPIVLGVAIIVMLLVFPAPCIAAAKDGLSLSLSVVFPSLFPFMVASRYIIATGGAERLAPHFRPVMKGLFRLPPASGIAFVLGVISGYPVGASAVADLVKNGQISKEQGEHMLAFCNNSGPLFIIGSVAVGMLSSPVYGYILYGIHFISAVLTGILMRASAPSYSGTRAKPRPYQDSVSAFTNAVTTSVYSMLSIIGYIVFFAVVIKILNILPLFGIVSSWFHINADLVHAFFSGILEMTNGISSLSFIPVNSNLKMALIAALIGFSGLCVLFQTKDAVKEAGLSLHKYVKGKALLAGISFVLAYLVFSFLPETVSVFHSNVSTVHTNPPFALYFWCSFIPSIVILILARNKYSR